MSDRRSIIQEIIEARDRRRSDLPTIELYSRLSHLQYAYEKRDENNKELLRYFPIALTACLESYFRLAIKHLIDSGDPYLSNAESLVSKGQFAFGIVKALHGKALTVGDVIAHSVSLSSLGHIASNMSSLMGIDFIEKVVSVHDRWNVEIRNQPKVPIVKDSQATYNYVAKTFDMRHIFCHETATKHVFDPAEINHCFDHTIVFLQASDEFISETLSPGAPLTQFEMNVRSAEEYQKEKAKLEQLNQKVLGLLESEHKAKYENIHKAWERFIALSVELEGMEYGRGTIRPTIENRAAARMSRERADQVVQLIDMLTAP